MDFLRLKSICLFLMVIWRYRLFQWLNSFGIIVCENKVQQQCIFVIRLEHSVILNQCTYSMTIMYRSIFAVLFYLDKMHSLLVNLRFMEKKCDEHIICTRRWMWDLWIPTLFSTLYPIFPNQKKHCTLMKCIWELIKCCGQVKVGRNPWWTQ